MEQMESMMSMMEMMQLMNENTSANHEDSNLMNMFSDLFCRLPLWWEVCEVVL